MIECVFYNMDDIYDDFGILPTLMVPLPLVVNALILQRHIFYDFVVVSRINPHTLSDVVENFREVVHLRSEVATSLLQHITQQDLAVSDLEAELKAHDTTGTGHIEVDDLRDVLSKFGYNLARFRFNSGVKLLFELEGTTVECTQVVRLVQVTQTENFCETLSVRHQQPHPMLRQSMALYDDVDLSSLRSQPNNNFFNSSQQFPVMTPPNIDDPRPSDFAYMESSMTKSQTSHRRAIPQTQQGNPPLLAAADDAVISSRALRDIYNLQQLSQSRVDTQNSSL
ncbi:unnamed protein product [Phytophthora lilii]|uniref:Unnamed protein product n=1 Tax=Phytophthora lilii TaxID=2077276 RepID=A0A9W6TZE7_9STRA|nr:unnamed protein product [Phytophthora lilii]